VPALKLSNFPSEGYDVMPLTNHVPVSLADPLPVLPPLGSTDRETVERFARLVLDSYGLTQWAFGWDRVRRRLGRCSYRRKLVTLSIHHAALNGRDEVQETILHEVAHCLTGPGNGYNHRWRSVARRIGAKPQRCSRTARTPAGAWQAICPSCGVTAHRYQRPKRLDGWFYQRCGRTNGKLVWLRKEGVS